MTTPDYTDPTSLPDLFVAMPELPLATQERAVVRVVCKGWARLRVTIAGEPSQTRWLAGGHHELSFTLAFGNHAVIERRSFMSHQLERLSLPDALWRLTDKAIQAEAGLVERPLALQMPLAEIDSEGVTPNIDPKSLHWAANIPAFEWVASSTALGQSLAFQHDARLSLPPALIKSESITPHLEASAFTVPILSADIDRISPVNHSTEPGATARTRRISDLQGAIK